MTATTQHQGPVGLLAEYLADVANQQSELGSFDCVRFVADALHAGFGVDLRDRLKYDDRRTAIARIRKHRGLDSAIRHELGNPIAHSDLRFGDIAFIPPHCVGLVMPGYIAVKSRATIWRFEMQCATHGWRVV